MKNSMFKVLNILKKTINNYNKNQKHNFTDATICNVASLLLPVLSLFCLKKNTWHIIILYLGDPCVNIVSERYEKEDTCNEYICFLVIITSVPSPCYAQWYVKSKGEEICLPLDVNAEEYQGSTNSLPRPKLVLIDKNYLKRNIYQIIVTNFVGNTVKDISGKT